MFEIKKHVAGTEGTHNYVVIGESKRGLVAVRLVNSAFFRVRVEPRDQASASAMSDMLSRAAGWKQPGDSDQNRFSTTTTRGAELHSVVGKAMAAISVDGESGHAGEEDWEGALAAVLMVGSTRREALVERVRGQQVAGAASAGRWTTTTLVAKLAAKPRAERRALIGRLRQAKVPGANLAGNWSLGTLRKKAVQVGTAA